MKSYSVPSPDRCNLPAAAIHASSDSVIIVDTDAPAAHIAQHKWQPNTPDGQGAPFLFQHGKAITSSAGGALRRMFRGPAAAGSGSDDWQFPQALAFASSGIRNSSIVSITCDKEIITGKGNLFLIICCPTLINLIVVVHFLFPFMNPSEIFLCNTCREFAASSLLLILYHIWILSLVLVLFIWKDAS